VERRYSSYTFPTSALDWGECQLHAPGRTLATRKDLVWAGPRAGLETEDRGKILLPLPGIEPRSPAYPTRSQTLGIY
jgi:hypothetical protein